MNKNLYLLIMACLALGAAAPASADFSVYYDVANWTTTRNPANVGGSVDTSDKPSSITMIGPDLQIEGNLNFTIPSGGTGLVSFHWSYHTLDVDGFLLDSTYTDPFVFLLNGIIQPPDPLNTVVSDPGQCTDPSDPNKCPTVSGNQQYFVNTGDVFGFRIQSDGFFGAGVATVSNFAAPLPEKVPEPGTLALLGIGLAAFKGMRRRKV